MDSEWEYKEPSPEELQEMEAKREKRDKISRRIGDCLLMGYCMLATSCPVCGVRFIMMNGMFMTLRLSCFAARPRRRCA
jgi:uncharacterized Zn finger protein (UPF0148 family)